MKVSTAVITTTRVLLNQTEVEEALVAYLRSKTDVPDNAKFDFDLGTNADDQFEAEITIIGGSDLPFDPPFAKPKDGLDEKTTEPKKGRRSVKVSQPIAAPSTAETSNETETSASPVVETTPLPTSPAAETSAETRNTFTVPKGHEAIRDEAGRATGETKPIDTPKHEEVGKDATRDGEAKPSATVTRIFPSPETSAPALAAAEPDPVTKAKSLFANLKPAG